MSINPNEPDNQSKKQELGTAYIKKNGVFSKVVLYEYSDLKIVDEVLNGNKPKKNKKNTLNKFLKPKKA